MTIKTYSRARAAVAAAKAVCESVGVIPADLPTNEFEPGRFVARIVLASDSDMSKFADVTGWLISCPEPVAEAPAAEASEEEVAPAPVVKKTSYIHEVSSTVGPTKMVWHIADAMKGKSRKEVIAACRERGIAYGTARTQYQAWKQANGL